MLNGDLSNRGGLSIGFRAEEGLIKYREETLKDRLFNKVLGKNRRAYIDEDYATVMRLVYRNTEYVVNLVIAPELYEDSHIQKLLDRQRAVYSSAILVNKPSHVTQRLLLGELSIYVDEDPERRSAVNSKYAIPLHELSQHVRYGYVRR